MPAASKLMIAFGGLVLLCALVGWGSAEPALQAGVVVGPVMILAGAAAAQGRRSVRQTGCIVGMILPVLTAGFAGWRAVAQIRNVPGTGVLVLLLLCILVLAGLLTTLVLLALRSGDGIAERGYSITPINPPTPQPHPESQEPANRH